MDKVTLRILLCSSASILNTGELHNTLWQYQAIFCQQLTPKNVSNALSSMQQSRTRRQRLPEKGGCISNKVYKHFEMLGLVNVM